MLSKILAKSDCANCKFCCSFRRQSLWETPLFPAADIPALKKINSLAKFRPAGSTGTMYTFDISASYKTTDPNEEAACPFLDKSRGCTLPPQLKPFDCKIWPLRAVKVPGANSETSQKIAVALTPTCPAINKVPLKTVCALASSGLGQKIISYSQENPDIIKPYSQFLSNIVYEE
ncbi:MAG: hypothetical protein J6X84_07140 [Treponema sp.]|nr:hypothetical protein [Treponema sp.]